MRGLHASRWAARACLGLRLSEGGPLRRGFAPWRWRTPGTPWGSPWRRWRPAPSPSPGLGFALPGCWPLAARPSTWPRPPRHLSYCARAALGASLPAKLHRHLRQARSSTGPHLRRLLDRMEGRIGRGAGGGGAVGTIDARAASQPSRHLRPPMPRSQRASRAAHPQLPSCRCQLSSASEPPQGTG